MVGIHLAVVNPLPSQHNWQNPRFPFIRVGHGRVSRKCHNRNLPNNRNCPWRNHIDFPLIQINADHGKAGLHFRSWDYIPLAEQFDL